MREPIRSLVISLPVPMNHVEALRRAFPDVSITTVEPDDLTQALEEADAVVAWRIPEEAIQNARNLKWIHRGAAGVEDLITPTLREMDIVLTNSSGVHAINISEHVLACMLAFARRLPKLINMQREHTWKGSRVIGVFELSGQTVTLAGLGDIGQAVATRAKALGMDTIGVRRNLALPRPDGVDTLMSSDRLHEALESANHVVNSLPLTSETRRIFDADAFAAMRPGTYFYNVGRGKTVDQDALIDALGRGRIAGAALDVTDPEPLPEDSPLWDMPNVIITGHTSGKTPEMWSRVFKLVETNLQRYQAGDPLVNVVD
ncbi:MAG TPA: D-2-hydroxyacid dehydrogenase, partial [Thermomicrobiales bacterium]|nr:D-2-hydroxyacid dehydrogenase [Thermomicrobiales bacterium]